MITHSQIESLHKLYCDLSELSVPLSMQRIYAWEIWGSKGFTEVELKLVIKHLKKQVWARRKTLWCLRFQTLIGNTEYFAEDLAEARALSRVQRPDPNRNQVLRASGRPEAKPNDHQVMTPAQIMSEHKSMAQLLNQFSKTL